MRKDFFTEAELMVMPLERVRGLDIEFPAQEQLVQKVVSRRLAKLPPSTPIYRRDVPDIETPEQEAEWQAKIDARMAKLRAPLMEFDVPTDEPPTSSPEPEELSAPTMRESAMAQATGEGKPVLLQTPVMGTIRQRGRPKKN